MCNICNFGMFSSNDDYHPSSRNFTPHFCRSFRNMRQALCVLQHGFCTVRCGFCRSQVPVLAGPETPTRQQDTTRPAREDAAAQRASGRIVAVISYNGHLPQSKPPTATEAILQRERLNHTAPPNRTPQIASYSVTRDLPALRLRWLVSRQRPAHRHPSCRRHAATP